MLEDLKEMVELFIVAMSRYGLFGLLTFSVAATAPGSAEDWSPDLPPVELVSVVTMAFFGALAFLISIVGVWFLVKSWPTDALKEVSDDHLVYEKPRWLYWVSIFSLATSQVAGQLAIASYEGIAHSPILIAFAFTSCGLFVTMVLVKIFLGDNARAHRSMSVEELKIIAER